MTAARQIFDTDYGYTVTASDDLDEGGHGSAKMAKWSGCPGDQFVLKIFHEEMGREATRKRNEFLIEKALNKRSSLFCGPVDQISHPKLVGHIAPFAQGERLDEFLGKAPRTLMQTHCAAIAIARGIELLHQEGLVHGDVTPANVVASGRGTVIVVRFIDLDNFRADKVPLPPSPGDTHYCPPEIVRRLKERKPAMPDKYADYFGLGVVLHIVLLFVHPAVGHDTPASLYAKAMWEGRWLLDPYAGTSPKCTGGRPSAILNASLAACFRRCMSLEPTERTPPSEWVRTLIKAAHEITVCPDCGRCMYFDSARKVCPYDNRPFPSLAAVLADGRRIPINSNQVTLGRDLLKSPHVSCVHAVLRKLSNETSLESLGRNGTWRMAKGGWEPIKPGERVDVAAGMKFKLADVEIRIEK